MTIASLASADDTLCYLHSAADSGSSLAVIVNDVPLAQTSQLFPVDQEGKLVGADNTEQQLAQVFRNVKECLAAAGADMNRIARLNVYVISDDVARVVRQSMAKQFSAGSKPATTFVVTALPIAGAHVALDAIAVAGPQGANSASASQVTTHPASSKDKASTRPRVTILPSGSRIYISGQAEKAATLSEATRLTLNSLEASLKFCGRTKADIAQVKCFLLPMKQSGDVDVEIEKFFAPLPVPAVSHVEWESTLPIEIEVVAHGGKPDSIPANRIEFLTPPGMTASPVFSRITRIHSPTTIFIGGLYGASGANGTDQVEKIFEQLGSALKDANSDFQHLAKATYYVSKDEPSQKLNELRPKYYKPDSPPAASKAQVRGVGAEGVGLTLDMIAVTAK